jgi:O-antigen biosynthesis protein WbqP
MKNNTHNLAIHILENPRQYLLKIAGLLRKLTLDELPNFINIIKGKIVFVDPRPALYNQVDLFLRDSLQIFEAYNIFLASDK